ncbi:MAG TPA: cobalamin-dependent protein [Marmoricola sp.]
MRSSGCIDPGPFERAVAVRSVDDAIAWAGERLDDGADPLDVLDTIAEVQRRVGERWASGEWTVAQEHDATSVAVATIEAVDARVRDVPSRNGHVVLTCAEREWHAVPALMVAAALRSRGWTVTVLGPSASVARFSAALQDLGPDATAVSCSVLGALPAARRFIEASRTAGIPVVVGGSAFGGDASRALALGATAWAAGAREAVETVAALPSVVLAGGSADDPSAQERAALELAADHLLGQVLRSWAASSSPESAESATMGGARVAEPAGVPVAEDLVQQSLRAVIASLLTGEPGPLHQTTAWVAALLQARGASLEHLRRLGVSMETELRDFPLAQRLVREHWA